MCFSKWNKILVSVAFLFHIFIYNNKTPISNSLLMYFTYIRLFVETPYFKNLIKTVKSYRKIFNFPANVRRIQQFNFSGRTFTGLVVYIYKYFMQEVRNLYSFHVSSLLYMWIEWCNINYILGFFTFFLSCVIRCSYVFIWWCQDAWK